MLSILRRLSVLSIAAALATGVAPLGAQGETPCPLATNSSDVDLLGSETRCTSATNPRCAVTYREMPASTFGMDRQLFEKGRRLWPQAHPEFGIDINSWVRVDIDTNCLDKIFADTARDESGVASARIEALKAALGALKEAVESTTKALESYPTQRDRNPAEVEAFGQAAAEMGRSVSTLLVNLMRARQLRMESLGLEPEAAQREADIWVSEMLPRGGTYDWAAIRRGLYQELVLAYQELEVEADARARYLRMDAHLIGKNGVHPIRLTGINDVATGSFSPVGLEPVMLSPPKASQAANELDAKASSTKKTGEAAREKNAVAAVEAATTAGAAATATDKKLAEMKANAHGAVTTAANLPLPDLPTLDGRPILTSFNLATITQSRSEGDVARVEFAVVRKKEDEFEVVRPRWEDNFILRRFGFQQKLSSGFAFVQQEGTSDWKPTAVVNYTFDWRRWPKRLDDAPTHDPAQDLGRRILVHHDYFSGLGLSLLTPDFDDEQDFEIALGVQLSFLADRLTVGHGWNLSADEDREFVYFSVNLFKGTIFDKASKLAEGSSNAGK